MAKKKRLVLGASTLICMLILMQMSTVFAALSLEDVTTWYWTEDTWINSVAVGDIDGDFKQEIVTGGYYYDGTRCVAQLCVWDGATLACEDFSTWYWVDDTVINSVAVGDVDGDTDVEIVTGGYYDDGTRDVAQLCVWDGATLALEDVTTWYWVGTTWVYAVAVGDVDGDFNLEIITGGYCHDGSRSNAQLCIWDGATLTLEDVTTWYWTSSTVIKSVAVSDVDGDTNMEIVTGGAFSDGTRGNAQLCVWDGSTLALEDVTTWYWTSSTGIMAVAVSDVDGDSNLEIVTGGCYHDYTKYNAQLCTWDGATLVLEDVTTWYWVGTTWVYAVAVGDVDGDTQMEIVTGGYYWDGTRNYAQLCTWNGATLALEDVTTWYWTSSTGIMSVAVSDVDGDSNLEIVTGGYYWDYTRYNAQLCVWG